ncbi:MAG: hypothetical protein CMF43_00735, partial [Legionellales bacterium]|nr:hypothetical protein [Legionellales bacterium]
SGILIKEYAVSYFSKTNIKMLKSRKTIFSQRGFPVSQNDLLFVLIYGLQRVQYLLLIMIKV